MGATEAGRLLVEDTRRQIRLRSRAGCGITVAGALAMTLAWLVPMLENDGKAFVLLIVIVPASLLTAAVVTLPIYAVWGIINRVVFEARAARLALPTRALREAIVHAPQELEGDELYAFVDAQVLALRDAR